VVGAFGADDDDRPVNLRRAGRLRVLQAVHAEAVNAGNGLSRLDIVDRTGLARGTVAAAVGELVAIGILVDDDPVVDTATVVQGRPPRQVRMAAEAGFAIGLDIARDHVRAVLCDLLGTPREDTGPIPMAVDRDPDATLLRAARLANDLAAHVAPDRVLGLGVGIASPVDRVSGTLLSEAVLPRWVGISVADDMARRTGLRVRVINDANAGLLAERRFGAARDVDDAIYLRLSAGIGAGLVADGRIVLGATGVSGELGHLTVVPDGSLCRCGNRGCLETVASPSAICAALAGDGPTFGTEQLLASIAAGRVDALRAVAAAGTMAGRAVAHAVMTVNPSLVVVGGELAEAGEVLLDPMRRAIAASTMRVHSSGLQVVAGVLGDAAGVRGAAAFVLDDAPRRLADLFQLIYR
jgi:predicted NBD/HSP70 family sugar kinase